VALTDEAKRHRAENPADYHAFRRRLEIEVNFTHEVTQLGSEMQRHAVDAFTANMNKKLVKKADILASLIPDFPVACRRVTPGPGYLEALVAEITHGGITSSSEGLERLCRVILHSHGVWK
jgi:hypothetical protein